MGTTFTVVSVNGNLRNETLIVIYLMFSEGGINDPSDASAEANLDTQVAFGLAYPIPVRIYVFYLNLLI